MAGAEYLLLQPGPLCRKFVGQVASKKGASGDNTGMTQKDQKAVIQDFRKGLFNVLVRCCWLSPCSRAVSHAKHSRVTFLSQHTAYNSGQIIIIIIMIGSSYEPKYELNQPTVGCLSSY